MPISRILWSLKKFLTILVFFSTMTNDANGGQQWCYQCNTNLSEGRKTECNDPYAPGSWIDLIQCDDRESHHCLKAVILYKNILVTTRGCVPTRTIESYCDFQDYYPDARIDCTFCKDYACNGSNGIINRQLHLNSRCSFFLFLATILLPNASILLST